MCTKFLDTGLACKSSVGVTRMGRKGLGITDVWVCNLSHIIIALSSDSQSCIVGLHHEFRG